MMRAIKQSFSLLLRPRQNADLHFVEDFSNIFLWMVIWVFWLNFHCSLLLKVHLTIIGSCIDMNKPELMAIPFSIAYRQTSNISRTKSKNLHVSRFVLQLPLCNTLTPSEVENEGVVGAAPTGDAPTTWEWSTNLLPTKVRLILKFWRYMFVCHPASLCYFKNATHDLSHRL